MHVSELVIMFVSVIKWFIKMTFSLPTPPEEKFTFSFFVFSYKTRAIRFYSREIEGGRDQYLYVRGIAHRLTGFTKESWRGWTTWRLRNVHITVIARKSRSEYTQYTYCMYLPCIIIEFIFNIQKVGGFTSIQ